MIHINCAQNEAVHDAETVTTNKDDGTLSETADHQSTAPPRAGKAVPRAMVTNAWPDIAIGERVGIRIGHRAALADVCFRG